MTAVDRLAACRCGHVRDARATPGDGHDDGRGECYVSGCKCRSFVERTTAVDRLAAIRARAEAATPGPWEAGDVWVYTPPIYPDDRRLSDVLGMKFADEDRAEAEHKRGLINAEFIAAARSDVPALVAALEGVLALHAKAAVTIAASDSALSIRETCAHCLWADTDHIYQPGEVPFWPCPTVRKIEEALNG